MSGASYWKRFLGIYVSVFDYVYVGVRVAKPPDISPIRLRS